MVRVDPNLFGEIPEFGEILVGVVGLASEKDDFCIFKNQGNGENMEVGMTFKKGPFSCFGR